MAQYIGTKADFSQNNPAWSNDFLGFSQIERMNNYGCLVAALASVAQAMGKGVNPGELNQILRANNLFSGPQGSDVARADVLARIYPDIKFTEVKWWPQSEVAPPKYFDVRSTTNDEIIIMLDYHPERAGIQQHWCRVIGLNASQSDLEIVDSYTGKRVWLSSISAKGGKKPFQLIWAAWRYRK